MIRAGLVGLVLFGASTACAQTGTDLAHCAGIADAYYGVALAEMDTVEMDYLADEAHIFMVLARHVQGAPDRTLKQMRVEAAAQLFAEGATDDSVHSEVQFCSDLRQQLVREGRWTETPDR